jgi:hypothetical protein
MANRFDELRDLKRREVFKQSPLQRQRSVAEAVLSTSNMAFTLRKLIASYEQVGIKSQEVEDAITYAETKILECFRECLGVDIKGIFDEDQKQAESQRKFRETFEEEILNAEDS